MTQSALPYDRFSRAGASVAALFAVLPAAAMGGALLIAPVVTLAGLAGAPWQRLHKAVLNAGLPLFIAAGFLVWVGLSTLWAHAGLDVRAATDFIVFVPLAFLLIVSAGLMRPTDHGLAARAAMAGVGLLMVFIIVETRFDFPIGRQLAREAAAPSGPLAQGAAGQDLAGQNAVEQNAVQQGAVEQGAVEQDAVQQGAVEQDEIGPGAVERGAVERGAVERGAVEKDPVDAGAAAPGARAEASPAGPVVSSEKIRNGDPALFHPDAARAAVTFSVCIWGAVVMLARRGWRGWVAMGALGAGAAWISLYYGGGVISAALGLGLVAALIALVWPRAGVSILAQTIAGGMILAPLVCAPLADLSAQALSQFFAIEPPFGWLQRAEMWAYASDMIKQRMLTGWGFGGSGQFDETYSLLGFTLPYIPRHPHNVPLQIWLETGAVGALLAGGALASFGRRAGAALADDRWAAAGAAGLLVTVAVIANVSGGTWALWWWGAVALGAALVRAAKRPT